MKIPQLTWPKKRVGEKDYRGADWADHLGAGETITDYGFTITGDNLLTVPSKASNGTETIGRFEGGTPGATASIVVSITTSAARVLEAVFTMPIE